MAQKSVYKILFIIFVCLFVIACQKSYDGDVVADRDVETDIVINEQGRVEYIAQCASCHGSDGSGGPGGTVINCAQCASLSELSEYIEQTMPTGGNEHLCSGDCAQDTAEYILGAFHDRSFGSVRSELEGLENLDARGTLRKAAMHLASRLPTQQEQDLVDTQGEDGLDAALDLLLEDDAFYERLMSFYNEQLLTDKYITSNDENGALRLISQDDFENVYWFNDDPTIEDNQRRCYQAVTNDALAREPLQLVRHLAKQNLPITQVVAADYIMVNWYSLKSYDAQLVSGENPDDAFDTATTTQQTDAQNQYWQCRDSRETLLPFNPNHFLPARINKATEWSSSGVPHAGILSSVMFLNRFPTTFTNRNRARASTIFDLFLDTDILAIEGARPEDAIDLGSSNPTLENQACYSCHHIMDPVASSFQHWTETGRYVQTTTQTNDNNWSSDGIQPPGLAGTVAPVSGGNSVFSSLLSWLGQQIADDPRYRRAVTRIIYQGLIGADTLVANQGSSESQKAAVDAQSEILDAVALEMQEQNFNIKVAVKGVLKSPYFRANAVTQSSDLVDSNTGSSRLIEPAQLQKKLASVLGNTWSDLDNTNNQILFGGMDSDDVTTRIKDPNGIMVAMQQRMSVEMSCNTVAPDFVRTRSPQENLRLLFPYVSTDTVPQDKDGFELESNISAIKQNIQYLHWRLLAEDVTSNSDEVNHTYALFQQVWLQGNQALKEDAQDNERFTVRPSVYLNWRCDAYEHPDTGEELSGEARINRDDNYVIRAWTAVVAYLISDYRFIFE